MYRRFAMPMICLLAVACGGGDDRLPDGGHCAVSVECLSDLCLNAVCVDPMSDPDHDGLSVSVEIAAGLDPLHPDTDGDGRPDGVEWGADPDHAADIDGDGIIDALESSKKDADLDCLPDQFDPVDAEMPATSAELVPVVCLLDGVCSTYSDLVVATCSDGEALCDYSAIESWNADEWWCDGLDNNCNGYIDEGFYYEGVGVGYPCLGPGECGAGVVECEPNGFVTRCSANPGGSADASVPEECDGLDNDCDSVTDNGIFWEGVALGQPCEGSGECGVGVVECLASGEAGCSTMEGGSKEQVIPEFCDGLDNDCDGLTDEAWSGDPSELCVFRGVCSQNPALVGVVCVDGVLACDYSDVPGYSGPYEFFCNGADDDCDGQVDEEVAFSIREPGLGVRYPGQTCGLGACSGGTVRCSTDGLAGECSSASSALTEACNDVDDDCDGIVDNGMFKYWKGPPGVLVDGEPQPRVASGMAAVEYPVDTGAPLESGIYVCGGARFVDDAVLSGFGGACWLWDIDTRRFSPIAAGPVLDSGALVFDQGRSRLLMPGTVLGESALRLWELSDTGGNWSEVGPSAPAESVLAAGMRTAGSIVWVLVRTAAGLAIASAAPDSTTFDIVPVTSTDAGEGSFAAFDPSGGFYLWHACDGEASTYLEFIGLDGSTRIDPLGEYGFCMSHGAAVMPDSETMYVMSGIDASGHVGGTKIFNNVGGVWQAHVLTKESEVGSVAWPAMAVSTSGILAFSGMDSGGRGLRRMLVLDEGLSAWTVASVLSGPSPRAAGASFACRSTASAYFLGGWGDEPGGAMPATDFWRLNLVTGLFVQITSSDTLGAAIEAEAAVDDDGGYAYLFGGLDDVPEQPGSPIDLFMRYGCDSGRWEKLQSGPPARHGHSLVWSGTELILYGGLNNEGFLGDIWTWTQDGGWVHEGDYGLRYGHSAFWDADGGRMIVAGGRPGGDVSAWYPETGQWEVITSGNLLDSSEGDSWFDPSSRTLLYLAATSEEALIVRFWGTAWESMPFAGLQADILSGFAVYDQFNRRGLLFGGMNPETGTVGSIIQMLQACPK